MSNKTYLLIYSLDFLHILLLKLVCPQNLVIFDIFLYLSIKILVCIVIAINAILSDRYLRELLEYIFNAPYLLKFITLSTLSGIIYFVGFKRQQQKPEKIFSNGQYYF